MLSVIMVSTIVLTGIIKSAKMCWVSWHNFVMLRVIFQSGIMHTGIVQSGIMLTGIVQSGIMLTFIVHIGIMHSDNVLSVLAQFCKVE